MHNFTPSFDFASRVKSAQKKLAKKNISLLALGSPGGFDANTYYFSGDTAFPTYLFITPTECTIYSSQPPAQFEKFANARSLNKFKEDAKKIFANKKTKTVAIDARAPGTARLMLELQKKKKTIESFSQELLAMRMIKDAEEIKCVQAAQKITNECLRELERMRQCGKLYNETENYLAGVLELRAREMGASLDAFPPLIQAGARASVFHESTSNAIAREGEVLLADIGARYSFYCGDATHTFYDGKDRQTKGAIEAVAEAKKAAMKKAKIGTKASALSQAALSVLKEYGFKKNTFRDAGLAIGHFTGLEVHDGLPLEQQTLARGMCFTIEPGIYIPKKFGVRFEDVVILK